jgi:hypothetical protein
MDENDNAPSPWQESLSDPIHAILDGTESDLPERLRRFAEPPRGEPAFDPEEIGRRAAALSLPAGSAWEHPVLEKAVRIGLAHVDATFDGDHPRYGVGSYADPVHDGFPPTIIAAVDALTLWGLIPRAEALFLYWLDRFVRPDGSIDYYGPSLSEYGQLLTTARRLQERGAEPTTVSRCREPLARLARYLRDRMQGAAGIELMRGVPEADTLGDPATYFHNNAWAVRGLDDYAAVREAEEGPTTEVEALRGAATTLRDLLLVAIRDTWPSDPDEWWLRPMVEAEGAGTMARPQKRVTDSWLGSYTNYRYWPELLSSGILPDDMASRVVRARLEGGGQFCGATRFLEDRLDDWPLMEYLEGLRRLNRFADYRLSVWGHIFYHQAEGHLTAYEQVTLPPGEKRADYCLPCQLVVARAAPFLTAITA